MKKTYKYRWKHANNEQSYACCYDCGIKYQDFQDMVIPDIFWEKINPTYHVGAGLLCPTCIVNRLNHLGLWYGVFSPLSIKSDITIQ